MPLQNVLFLLDENVSYRLKRLFRRLNLQCSSVQQEGWTGVKNGELSLKIKERNAVLLTRDRDFTFLWSKNGLKVIYIAIEPPVAEVIAGELERLLTNWTIALDVPFLIVLQEGSVRLWK